jgi:hypothetical protein
VAGAVLVGALVAPGPLLVLTGAVAAAPPAEDAMPAKAPLFGGIGLWPPSEPHPATPSAEMNNPNPPTRCARSDICDDASVFQRAAAREGKIRSFVVE